ncbi:MAG: glycosyltransferase family 2 protein, partial [Microcystaceae cyanobacterium]
MTDKSPKVSIGLPVFNGENYLREAIDSVLAQTFTDFELIISDNASTDRTEEISQAYVAKDKRIHYYRNEQNLGVVGNLNRIMELPAGEYFQWLSHDNILAPTYVEKCIAVLDQDPSIILCHSKVLIINKYGKSNEYLNVDPLIKINIDSYQPQERFYEIVLGSALGPYIMGLLLGVMRTSLLKRIGPVTAFVEHDRAYLAKLSLQGRFYEIPERLFFVRQHP